MRRKPKQQRSRRSKPQVGRLVVKIAPGQKLLWQKNPTCYGFDLNIVDAQVQE